MHLTTPMHKRCKVGMVYSVHSNMLHNKVLAYIFLSFHQWRYTGWIPMNVSCILEKSFDGTSYSKSDKLQGFGVRGRGMHN